MVGSSGILDIRKEKKVVMMTDKLISKEIDLLAV